MLLWSRRVEGAHPPPRPPNPPGTLRVPARGGPSALRAWDTRTLGKPQGPFKDGYGSRETWGSDPRVYGGQSDRTQPGRKPGPRSALHRPARARPLGIHDGWTTEGRTEPPSVPRAVPARGAGGAPTLGLSSVSAEARRETVPRPEELVVQAPDHPGHHLGRQTHPDSPEPITPGVSATSRETSSSTTSSAF